MENTPVDVLFTMLKGEPGTRKSTAAVTYPTPQYWVSTDQKMQALVLPMKRFGIKPQDVSYDDYSDWDKPKAKLEQLQVSCPFKTIIIDSITSIGDNMNRQTRKQKRNDGSGKMIGSIQVSGLEEYNAESAGFQELIAILKDIHHYHKVNIILVAHVVGQRKNDDGNKLTHHSRVIVTGGDKIAAKVSSYMTEVYHFNVKTGFNVDAGDDKYALITRHTGNDFARTSLPLDKEIVFHDDPLYDKYILPGINKLKAEKPVERIQNTPPPSVNTNIVQPFTK